MKWAYDHELKRRDCVSRKIRDMGRQPGAGVLVVGRRVPHGALPSPIIDSFCLRVVRAMRCRLDGECGAVHRVCGTYILQFSPGPLETKRMAVRLEQDLWYGFLVDVDVYDGFIPVTRHSLGLPPRSCYVCGSPSKECVVKSRHSRPRTIVKIWISLIGRAILHRVRPNGKMRGENSSES